MCAALNVSRRLPRFWLTRFLSQRARADEGLPAKVRTSFVGSDRIYGARRVWRDLPAESLMRDNLLALDDAQRRVAPLGPGDGVRITRREGIPPKFMTGDVGTVMLCNPEFPPPTTLTGVNASVMPIHFTVQTERLERV